MHCNLLLLATLALTTKIIARPLQSPDIADRESTLAKKNAAPAEFVNLGEGEWKREAKPSEFVNWDEGEWKREAKPSEFVNWDEGEWKREAKPSDFVNWDEGEWKREANQGVEARTPEPKVASILPPLLAAESRS